MKARLWNLRAVLLVAAFTGLFYAEGMAGTNSRMNELNSGERIPRRFCRGVSEQRNKEVLDGIGFLAGSAARSFNSAKPAAGYPIGGTINEGEAAGLLFMADEEKMARDVYTAFYKLYKISVFNNISKSEQAHKAAVGNLIGAFGLEYTGRDKPGEFVDPEITKLYGELINMGEKSLIDALKAGALIEETDILDLKKELATVENASIKRVFTNLLAGSETHLRVFVNHLKIKKIIYDPLLIKDLEYYKAILSNTTGTRK